MPLVVTYTARTDEATQQRSGIADVTLAPLAAGEYVLEISIEKNGKTEVVVIRLSNHSVKTSLAAVALLLSLAVTAQEPLPRFRAGANLVSVDAYVSKDGKPVTDLKSGRDRNPRGRSSAADRRVSHRPRAGAGHRAHQSRSDDRC